MHSKGHTHHSMLGMSWNPTGVAFTVVLMLLFLIFLFLFLTLTAQPAQGQTYKVIYNFTGGPEGNLPKAGLAMDRAGNLYGTSSAGGYSGSGECAIHYYCGAVFELSPRSSGWSLSTLHAFRGDSDGANAQAAVKFGPDGALYGTTVSGGAHSGTAFKLTLPWVQPASVLDGWMETVIYRFEPLWTGDSILLSGDIVFDQTGNVYGTSYAGGSFAAGSVYKLTRGHDGWSKTDIHSFSLGDGAGPFGGVVFDTAGNLYGTTAQGGPQSYGTIFQLTPFGSTWTERVLYYFQNGIDGWYPVGGLIRDEAGNLYGTTATGASGSGVVFELSPSGAGWNFKVLCDVAGTNWGPMASLVMDRAGNLYGTSYAGGPYQWGSVFKAAPSSDGWTCTSLQDFTDGNDGGLPLSRLVIDTQGNLYGTTSYGGLYGGGVVFEITP